MSVEFRVDPKTKSLVKVTEATTTEDELRAELQAAADQAQNRLNSANEAKVMADADLKAAEEQLELAETEVAEATDEVQFSADKLGDLDEAVRVLAEVAGAEPAAEDAGNTEEVDLSDQIHVAESAPA